MAKSTYVQLLDENIEIQVSDKAKLVVSVSKEEGSEGNPHVDIRTHITSGSYTGPTKKGINFDVENIEEIIEALQNVNTELMNKGY